MAFAESTAVGTGLVLSDIQVVGGVERRGYLSHVSVDIHAHGDFHSLLAFIQAVESPPGWAAVSVLEVTLARDTGDEELPRSSPLALAIRVERLFRNDATAVRQ